MIQYMKMNPYNPPYKKTEQEKPTCSFYEMTKRNFDKIHNPFMIKIMEKLGTQRTHLNIIKTTFRKPITVIKLNESDSKQSH